MAIPLGRTAGNIQSLARWTYAGAVAFGVLGWWAPGFRLWGAMTVSLLAVWTLWLMERLVRSDRTVSGHPVYLALLGPAAILATHAVLNMAAAGRQYSLALGGSLDASMLSQLGLLALGMLLAQSLLPRAARHAGVLLAAGGAMMAGAILAAWLALPATVHMAVGLVGFAGVGVWLTPLWNVPDAAAPGWFALRSVRLACAAIAAVAAALLAWYAPPAAVVAMIAFAGVLALAAIVFPGRRVPRLCISLGLGVAAYAALTTWPQSLGLTGLTPGLFGRGEQAFSQLTAADSGLAVITGATGWMGMAWLTGGLALGIFYLLTCARRGKPADRDRAVVWTTSAVLAACALLAPGGLFLPSATLAAAMVWGLLPSMLGRENRPRNGAWFLAGVAPLVVLMELAPHGALPSWAGEALGAGDKTLHFGGGFFLAMVGIWLASKRLWTVILALLAAVLIGGAAEGLQWAASSRNAQFADWAVHALGCAAAVPIYLLCVASRWCESAAAPTHHPESWRP